MANENADTKPKSEVVFMNGGDNEIRQRKVVIITEKDVKDSWLELRLGKLSESTENFVKKHDTSIGIVKVFAINGLIFGYFFAALYYFLYYSNSTFDYCSGFGSLAIILTLVYLLLFYFLIVKKYFSNFLNKCLWKPIQKIWRFLWKTRLFRYSFIFLVLFGSAVFLYLDTKGNEDRLISLIGLGVFVFLGFVFSKSPTRIKWSTVFSGLILQFVFGLITIRWRFGREVIQCFADKVATFLSYGLEGSSFVFSEFLVQETQVFAFSSLTILFFSCTVIEVLFFWGALQWFCIKVGSLLQSVTGVTICEGIVAVGNVFLGNTESALVVKEYLKDLTPSEIHLVMASGFATVSGTILAAYIAFGADPGHLITASVMSAPAAIMFAKLLYPETEESKTSKDNIQLVVSQDTSAIGAATRGATNGINLVLNIIANLVAFVSLVAMFNGLLGFFGGIFDFPELNLEWIFGKVFIPLSWIMGVPWIECEAVGTLIGLKTVVNEFVAYQRMGEFKEAGLLSARGEAIATYALCGFTNPASGGIMIGTLAAMAPNQRETLAAVVVRAFFAGCAICFMTACIAGILLPADSFGSTRMMEILTNNQTNSTLL